MELSIKPHTINRFPLNGILIQHASPDHWIREIQRMQLTIRETEVYPIPGLLPNSVWGCLVIPAQPLAHELIGKNEWCQQAHTNLFIPEKAVLYPAVSEAELSQLFAAGKHLFHPAFGLAELGSPIDFKELLHSAALLHPEITVPRKTPFIPSQIRSFQVQAVSPEEALKHLQENIFPQQEPREEKPLSFGEKAKLTLYKWLLRPKRGTGDKELPSGTIAGNPSAQKAPGFFSKLLLKMPNLLGSFGNKMADRMQRDLEELERRNQKQVDKLMELFKNDPLEALKYAIPLDEGGTGRGGNTAELDLSRRWSGFSLFGGNFSGGGSGSGTISRNHYMELQNQYRRTAQGLMEQEEYHKAAFIYLKLLKEPHKGAEALETGKLYQDAAAIYLQNNNKLKAAECYEKCNATGEAIRLYKEIDEPEKAGDLYVRIGNRQEANLLYQQVASAYIDNKQFLKASVVYSDKMQDMAGGQSLLLEGWRTNSNASDCLEKYFSTIADTKERGKEIRTIYTQEVGHGNEVEFMHVIKTEYDKKNELAAPIRDMAYEIIARQLPYNPDIVSGLKTFNPSDTELTKDTMRYKMLRKKK